MREAVHKDWMWLDTEKDVGFSSFTSVHSELATCGIYSVDEWCDNRIADGSRGRRNEETNGVEPAKSFAKAYVLKTVKSFCYLHSICGYEEQNILNVELLLLCLSHKVLK
jgi:hypothetical protein